MEQITRNNKGQVSSTIVGIIGLVFTVVIGFVLISTLLDSNVIADESETHTVTNETSVNVNRTGLILSRFNSSNTNFVVTALWNATDNGNGYYNLSIPTGNASIDSLGNITNATIFEWNNVSVSYTFTYTHNGIYEDTANSLSVNLTQGVQNVSNKIPTILLIVAVVFLFGALALLVLQARRMGMFGNDGGGF